MLYGYPYWLNNDLATMAANAKKVMLFGDFGYYIIVDVGSVRYQRLDEVFAQQGVVAFLGWAEADGRYRGDMNAIAALNIKA